MSPPVRDEERSATQSESSPFAGTNRLPLESGDRLTRREFERRYAAQPDIKKAELIEGVVHLPPPVPFAGHGEPHAWIVFWLTTYSTHTPGVRVAGNASIRLDSRNEPQPDALLRIEREAGGRSRVSDDDYVEGAPELVVEVASSSAACGLHERRHAYIRNGVQEYVLWRVDDQAVDWFVLKDGDYRPLAADATDGVIRSEVFPGLRLAVNGLLTENVSELLAALCEGIGRREHIEFVERLLLQSKA